MKTASGKKTKAKKERLMAVRRRKKHKKARGGGDNKAGRPRWIYLLTAEALKVAAVRGYEYPSDVAADNAAIHAEAERRLGQPFADLVARERLEYAPP